jgi:hypothetical protein
VVVISTTLVAYLRPLSASEFLRIPSGSTTAVELFYQVHYPVSATRPGFLFGFGCKLIFVI